MRGCRAYATSISGAVIQLKDFTVVFDNAIKGFVLQVDQAEVDHRRLRVAEFAPISCVDRIAYLAIMGGFER